MLLYLLMQGVAQTVAVLLFLPADKPANLVLALVAIGIQLAVLGMVAALNLIQDNCAWLRHDEYADSPVSCLLFAVSASVFVGMVTMLAVIWLYDKLLGVGLFAALVYSVWSAIGGACVNAATIAWQLWRR